MSGCASWGSGPLGKSLDSRLELTLTVKNGEYRPGEAVVADLTLRNKTGQPLTVRMLDHASMKFACAPLEGDTPGEQIIHEPIFSAKEPKDTDAVIAPGGKVQRRFVFTRLTFKRGDFLLQAVYESTPAVGYTRPAEKVYARPVKFSVKGEKAVVHRYVDGLMAKEDAIALAQGRLGNKAGKADAILIEDPLGYMKWWVNIEPQGGGAVRSWWIDPYLAKIWKDVSPFQQKDIESQVNINKDSKAVQKLKEKWGK
jgi:hypothetical protein